jgi:hypothetical protein
MKIFIYLLIFYIIFIWDFKINLSNNNWQIDIEYHGLLWVILDYYTIIKYHSDDVPMKWFKYVKIKKYGN